MKKRKILITIFIIILLIICVYEIYHIILRRVYPTNYSEHVEKYSKKYEIDEKWIYALIKAESNFKPDSVSQSGAVRSYATNGRNSIRSCKRDRDKRNRFDGTRM